MSSNALTTLGPGATDDAGSASSLEGVDAREGRFFVALTGITLVAQLAALQIREALFGGMGWLTSVKYTAWGERIGLTAVLAVFCLATVGLWLSLFGGAFLHRLCRVERFKAQAIASATWVALLVLDFMVRQKVFEILGDAFDLFGVSSGVGGLGRMMTNVWNWYSDLILMTLAGCVGVGVGCYALLRFFRSRARSWGAVDRIQRRHVHRVVVGAHVTGLLFLTAGATLWPTTRDVIADDTLVGAPLGGLVIWTTDFDGDGYSQFDNPPDTAPFDASRHPHALDRPDDGVDQDLIGGDLQLDALAPRYRDLVDRLSGYAPITFTERRNVILIVLESVRDDAFDTTLDGRLVTPRMRELVADGALRIPDAHAAKGFTQSTMMHLFWGAFFHPGTTLVDDFLSNGYRVAAFSGYDLADEGFELNLGLDHSHHTVDARHDAAPTLPAKTVPARRVAASIRAFLESPAARRDPFFMYVFLEDAHFPYAQDNPPVFSRGPIARSDIGADNRDALLRVYLDHVFHMDAAVGDIHDALREQGLAEDTLTVIISDHGESLFDDGFLLGHGIQLTDVMTRCLAIVDGARRDWPALLSHYDLRRLLREELSAPPTPSPRVVPPGEDALVLHFLGNPEWPTHIGALDARGRIVYDFKNHTIHDQRSDARFRLDDDDIPAPLLERAHDLIYGWEYLHWQSRDLGRWDYDY